MSKSIAVPSVTVDPLEFLVLWMWMTEPKILVVKAALESKLVDSQELSPKVSLRLVAVPSVATSVTELSSNSEAIWLVEITFSKLPDPPDPVAPACCEVSVVKVAASFQVEVPFF